MSHIHIQDGILPLWLVLIGLLFVLGYIIFLPFYLKKHAVNKKLAIVGVMAAIMLISMSVEIIPPAYHMNLAILAGIILGPVLSVMSILVTNVLLAFLGHGGVSVIGLNTLVVSFEAILGFFGFKILKSRIKNVFLSAFIASFIALFVAAWTSIGIVYVGTKSPENVLHTHNHTCEHDHSAQNIHEDEMEEISFHEMEEHHHEAHSAQMEFDINKFIIAVLSLGALGWIIESAVTAFIVNYIKKIRPDIIGESQNLDLDQSS